ncbi:unnamed protein product, partial [Prorocentrum cordatum]
MATAAGAAAEELLEVPGCRAVLVGAGAPAPGRPRAAAAEEQGAPLVAQFAEGPLRVLRLLPQPGDGPDSPRRVIVLAILGDAAGERQAGFFYPLLPGTPAVCSTAEGTSCLTLPDPEDGADSFGVVFPAASGLEAVARLLEGAGCSVWWAAEGGSGGAAARSESAPSQAASATAGTVREVASGVACALEIGGSLLARGIRFAAEKSKAASIMQPSGEPLQVPEAARQGVRAARDISCGVVQVSAAAIEAVAGLAGAAAGELAKQAGGGQDGGPEKQWVADAKFVGGAALDGGISIFSALNNSGQPPNNAADVVVQQSLGSGADLVGHRYGEAAGATTREGFHVVGNLWEARGLTSKRA